MSEGYDGGQEAERIDERLIELHATGQSDSSPKIDKRVMLLRLELIVLLDACDSPRWHAILAIEQSRGSNHDPRWRACFAATPTSRTSAKIIQTKTISYC
jgi:hypothetical protein